MRTRSGRARRLVAPFLLLAAAVLAVTGPGSDAQQAVIGLTVQGASTGGIEGAVTAGDGRTVADARLTFLDEPGDEFVGRAFTDAAGRYTFDMPASGCYSVIVDTPAGDPSDEIHSMRGGFCVGDSGIQSAVLDLS